MTREELENDRRLVIAEINNYDLQRNKNEERHQWRQAQLKAELFENIELLAKIEKEIFLFDLVDFCNTPRLFAPVV